MIGRIFRTTAGAYTCFSRRVCSFSTNPFDAGSAQEQHWRYLRNPHNGAEIYLVGTCHASSSSAKEVKEMIRAIKPTSVALELCTGRARGLLSGNQSETFSPRDFLNFPGSLGQNLSQSFNPLQELLKLFGINYGQEFKIAVEECNKIGGKLVYIDQDIDVTLQEVRKSLSFLQITKLVMNLPQHVSRYPSLADIPGINSIEDFLRDKKLQQELFLFLEEHFPEAMKAILHDRNEHMVKQLRERDGTIVAVVGLAHVAGMEKLWRELQG